MLQAFRPDSATATPYFFSVPGDHFFDWVSAQAGDTLLGKANELLEMPPIYRKEKEGVKKVYHLFSQLLEKGKPTAVSEWLESMWLRQPTWFVAFLGDLLKVPENHDAHFIFFQKMVLAIPSAASITVDDMPKVASARFRGKLAEKLGTLMILPKMNEEEAQDQQDIAMDDFRRKKLSYLGLLPSKNNKIVLNWLVLALKEFWDEHAKVLKDFEQKQHAIETYQLIINTVLPECDVQSFLDLYHAFSEQSDFTLFFKDYFQSQAVLTKIGQYLQDPQLTALQKRDLNLCDESIKEGVLLLLKQLQDDVLIEDHTTVLNWLSKREEASVNQDWRIVYFNSSLDTISNILKGMGRQDVVAPICFAIDETFSAFRLGMKLRKAILERIEFEHIIEKGRDERGNQNTRISLTRLSRALYQREAPFFATHDGRPFREALQDPVFRKEKMQQLGEDINTMSLTPSYLAEMIQEYIHLIESSLSLALSSEIPGFDLDAWINDFFKSGNGTHDFFAYTIPFYVKKSEVLFPLFEKIMQCTSAENKLSDDYLYAERDIDRLYRQYFEKKLAQYLENKQVPSLASITSSNNPYFLHILTSVLSNDELLANHFNAGRKEPKQLFKSSKERKAEATIQSLNLDLWIEFKQSLASEMAKYDFYYSFMIFDSFLTEPEQRKAYYEMCCGDLVYIQAIQDYLKTQPRNDKAYKIAEYLSIHLLQNDEENDQDHLSAERSAGFVSDTLTKYFKEATEASEWSSDWAVPEEVEFKRRGWQEEAREQLQEARQEAAENLRFAGIMARQAPKLLFSRTPYDPREEHILQLEDPEVLLQQSTVNASSTKKGEQEIEMKWICRLKQ